MKLRWLELKQACVLELKPLKDYAGQPLVFRPRGLTRKCVRQEVFDHELIRRYLRLGILAEIGVKPTAVPAAPTQDMAPAPTPPPAPEPVPEAAPEISVSSEPEPTLEPLEEVTEAGADQEMEEEEETADTSEGSTESTRRKKRRNR